MAGLARVVALTLTPTRPAPLAVPSGRLRPPVALVRAVAVFAVVALGAIVVTGAGVRLTSSGLGCPTWPDCSGSALVPTRAVTGHTLVEFGNRVIGVAVFLPVALLPILTARMRPRRPGAVRLSWLLVAGYLAQAVLGGITVLLKLAPEAVAAHFLVSMGLIAVAVVLVRRLSEPAETPLPRESRWLVAAFTAVAGLVLIAGTVVTGAGPHSGDSSRVSRLPFAVRDVAQAHADLAFLLTGLLIAVLALLRSAAVPATTRRTGWLIAGLVGAQITVGYVQYALGVPAGLVAVHVALATALWTVSVHLLLQARAAR